MRAKEAAEYLRVSPATLAKLRCLGGGPRFAKPSARLVLYDRQDLDAWLRRAGCSTARERNP